MYKTNFLIISRKKEQSVKYKKLIEGINQNAIFTNNLSEALSIIQKQENEFIIISDSIKENLSDFIGKIRVLTYNTHPVIIAVSKSTELSDKINVLESGADDYLGEEITKQEFQMRIKAHLRRYIESSINFSTHLLNKNLTLKALKKSFLNQEENSYILIKIKNLEIYKKTHGEIAQEKVMQTLSAIINSTLAQNDFIGHINDNDLILITNPIQAEKLASFLAFAFDNILNKFYSTDDFENNFMLQNDETIQETKTSLMHLNITIIEKNNEKEYKNIVNRLYELLNLCKNKDKSNYVIDRIKLNGKVEKQSLKNKVLIFEPDDSLSYLLKNICEINNIEAKTVLNKKDFYKIYNEFSPQVVLLDWGTKDESENLKILQDISGDNIKIIFSSSCLNKKEILKAGADLYLPKPYDIDNVINWIKKFLNY